MVQEVQSGPRGKERTCLEPLLHCLSAIREEPDWTLYFHLLPFDVLCGLGAVKQMACLCFTFHSM